MSDQHLNELFIDGVKVDQWATKDGDEEVQRTESEWAAWIDRSALPMPKNERQ
jgi:hypothetical protein